jgi:hypothetical protein
MTVLRGISPEASISRRRRVASMPLRTGMLRGKSQKQESQKIRQSGRPQYAQSIQKKGHT